MTRKRAMIAAAAAVTLGLAACEAGVEGDMTAAAGVAEGISGDWMIDVETAAFEGDPDELMLQDGRYGCLSCPTPYSVPADGEWHAVDQPTIDQLMVEVMDERTVRIAGRLAGEDRFESRYGVSSDGNRLHRDKRAMTGAEMVKSTASWTRVGAGPEGSHAMSGRWQFEGVENVSAAGLRMSFRVEGNQFTASGNGERYTATLGGEPVAIEGDETGRRVAVERIGDAAYRETFSRDGEPLSTVEWTLDGKDRLNGVYRSAQNNDVTRFSATRV